MDAPVFKARRQNVQGHAFVLPREAKRCAVGAPALLEEPAIVADLEGGFDSGGESSKSSGACVAEPDSRAAPPTPISSGEQECAEVPPSAASASAGGSAPEAASSSVDANLTAAKTFLSSCHWGVFKITPKQPGSKGGGSFGGMKALVAFTAEMQ